MSAAQDSFDSDFDRPDNDIERANGDNSEDEEKPFRRKKKLLRKNRGKGVFDKAESDQEEIGDEGKKKVKFERKKFIRRER